MSYELVLTRRWLSPKSTIGLLERPSPGPVLTAPLPMFTLERHRDGAGIVCIPEGRYRLSWGHSPKFGQNKLHVENVPGRQHILIHEGNEPKDTEGCVCTGLKRGEDRVDESRKALAELEADVVPRIMRGEEVWLTVKLAPPEERLVC